MQMTTRVWAVGAALGVAGCTASLPPVDTTTLNTSGPKLSMTDAPKGQELGTVAVASRDGLQDALRQFRDAVIKAGGDFGKIDRLTTSFNARHTAATNCTASASVIECKGSDVVVPEVDLYGRAFRVAGAPTGGQ
jgi:hypothetical protein